MNRKKLALLVALVLLILSVGWSYFATPRYKTVAPGTAPARKTATTARVSTVTKNTAAAPSAAVVAKPASPSDDRILKLDMLEREQSGFKGYRRNIFKPVFADEIKVMKQKAAAIKPLPIPPVAVVAKPVPVVQPPVQPADKMEIHKSTLAQFKFLGFLKKDNRKTIFLSKDKEIVLVRKGERFAKLYEATSITEQALTIKVIETGEEIIIPLTENKSLAAARK